MYFLKYNQWKADRSVGGGFKDKKIHAVFYKTESGNEPVKNELLNLGRPAKTIHEIRSKVFVGGATKKYRVLIFVINDLMILTHVFENKTRTTPTKEINLAWNRMKKWMREQKANHEKK